MKRALVRTSYLLSPKLSCTNPFDKTCIDNTELKIEFRNIAIDRKQMMRQWRCQRLRRWLRRRWRCLRFQTILTPKYLLLYYSSNTITIAKKQLNQLSSTLASTIFLE